MTQLIDPLNNRVVKSVPLPFQRPMTEEQLFPGANKVDWEFLRDFLKREGKLPKPLLFALIDRAGKVLKDEPNVLKIKDPLTIVGDIHGQYFDLVKLLENTTGGDPASTTYLFLGDYVDRGHFSIEVLCLILSLKLALPKTIFLLRGNHECQQLTSFFNFRKECLLKYDQDTYQKFIQLFNCLPLSAVVNNKFLCVHGGISTDIKSIQCIEKIDRFKEIPRSGLFCDLMWADPVDNNNGELGSVVKANDVRGCSYFFGYELCKQFLKPNKLLSVIRAHEAQANGYKMYHWGGEKQFPTVITIFSAPNYCDFYNNKAAVIRLMNNTLDIQQFLENPHPYFLPNFLDLFEWSVPFMAEKVGEILKHLVKPDRKFVADTEIPLSLMQKADMLEKIINMRKKQSEENTELISLGGRTLDNHLSEDKKAREYTKKIFKRDFNAKKEIDSKYEKRPEDEKTHG